MSFTSLFSCDKAYGGGMRVCFMSKASMISCNTDQRLVISCKELHATLNKYVIMHRNVRKTENTSYIK